MKAMNRKDRSWKGCAVLFLTLVAVWIDPGMVLGQDDQADPKDKASQERLDFMYSSASGFAGTRENDDAPIKIFERPLLRFTNPLHGCREGLFIAWVDPNNRPVAAGQVFLMARTDNDWYIETQSLADCPIELRSETNGSWSPTNAGIKWNSFDTDSPVPSRSKPLRLSQMRKLAAKFRVEDDLIGNKDILRLMSNPMIRYQDPENKVIDGALFAFVQGTDPELLVQLEARENTKTGKPEYFWALSAMTSAPVVAYLDGNAVWSKDRSAGGSSEVFYMRPLRGGVPYPME